MFTACKTRTNRLRPGSIGRHLTIGEPSLSLAGNFVSSRRFSWLSFLPGTLLLHFRKYSNCYLLMCVLLMLIPGVTTLNPMSAAGPLIFVLLVSEIREFIQEWMAWNRDKLVNNASVLVLSDCKDNLFTIGRWASLKPGAVVKIREGEEIPADLVLLSSSGLLAFVETSKLDGETNLKRKVPISCPESASLLAEIQHADMYRFKGLVNGAHPLSIENLLLRGSRLKSTEWIIGVVVYAGRDTKAEINAAAQKDSAKFIKSTKLDLLMNRAVFALFACQLVLCALLSWASIQTEYVDAGGLWYLTKSKGASQDQHPSIDDVFEGRGWLMQFCSFMIILATFIPASMWVACEVIRMCHAFSIDRDKISNIKCNSQNMHDDLGQITHIFSDKTGTLTANEMQFVGCLIGGRNFQQKNDSYPASEPTLTFDGVNAPSAELVAELIDVYGNLFSTPTGSISPRRKPSALDSTENARSLLFFKVLALCHTCELGRASSPDEGALVSLAAEVGLNYLVENESCTPLRIVEFTSERKMMTVAVKIEQVVYVLTKGADSSVLGRCSGSSDAEISSTQKAVDRFCAQGLRVLCIAGKELSMTEWDLMAHAFERAEVAESLGQANDLERLVKELESGLSILGCTAVKDALQPRVIESLQSFKNAGIRFAMITGDKRETAIGVAQSCGLITNKNNVHVMLAHPRMFGGGNFVPLTLLQELNGICGIQESVSNGSSEGWGGSDSRFSVIVDGGTLLSISLSDTAAKRLADVVNHPQCETAIFCRVSPKQKGEIVEIFKKFSQSDTRILAIGDGTNDINMLRLSHVGVGIAGREGSQAANSADYSIKAFNDLYRLMFYHGRICSYRLSNFVHIFAYKNVAFTLCQLWYNFYCTFSGASLFEGWYIMLFNSCFGSMPFWMGSLFDVDVYSDKNSYGDKLDGLSDRDWDTVIVPRLYKEAQLHFKPKSFAKWFGYGLLHSVIIFFGASVFRSDIAGHNGTVMDAWIYSVLVYTVLVTVVSFMNLLYTAEITLMFISLIVVFNFAAYFIFVFVYDWIMRSTSDPVAYSSENVFCNISFWLIVTILSFLCIVPNLILRVRKLFGLSSQKTTLTETLNLVNVGTLLVKSFSSKTKLP